MNGFKAIDPILIVEDNRNIASLLDKYLVRDGFNTMVAHDGMEALEILSRGFPSLIILDMMLPGIDGWKICQHVRQTSLTPILVLTALTQEAEKIRGFSLGVDDYVIKPFSPREVVERVKAILRRTQVSKPAQQQNIQFGNLTLEPEKHKVSLNNETISLTALEYSLLHTFMMRPGKVFSRQELLDRVYTNDAAVVDRVIDVHIGKLRQKIEPDPTNPTYIKTRRGFGYQFMDT